MTEDATDQIIRRAIGGDHDAGAWIVAAAEETDQPTLLVMAALVAPLPRARALLERAEDLATNREDRQLVVIARAHLSGRRELVDALARDHLVDFPGSYVIAWIASGAEFTGGAVPQTGVERLRYGQDDR